MTGDGLRILCLTETYPWPPTSGYQLRMATVVRGLERVGSVDLWVAALEPSGAGTGRSPEGGVARARVTLASRRAPSGRLVQWMVGHLPRAQLEIDPTNVRADLASFATGRYDLVWCGHLRTYLWTRGVVSAPVVLDLDDLGDAALQHRGRAAREWRPHTGLRADLRGAVARIADRIDAGRYREVHANVAREVARVAVCSDLDRRLLGHPDNTVIVPNTYREPEPPAQLRTPDASHPRFLMIGRFDYTPNIDGARFFVDQVLPKLRADIPGAALRLVGRHGGMLDDLARVDGVVVAGEVPDVDAELRAADASIVPLRFGGGTRVKILEAFAYRLPVVSTTVGSEGIDAVNGEQLLIADTPEDLAAACVRAVRDERLRRRLTDGAWTLFENHYRSDVAEDAVARIAERAASVSHR